MKRFLILLGLLCASVSAQPFVSQDEQAVRSVVERELEGWVKFDAKQIASTYSDDAIWQNPFGVRLHGSAQLEKFLAAGVSLGQGHRAGEDSGCAHDLSDQRGGVER
jgi:hypothetical protein